MLKKRFPFFLLAFLYSVIFPRYTFPQNTLSTNPAPLPPLSTKQNNVQISPGFRRGPWASPTGMRWVPGHFKVINGEKMWIRGSHQPIQGSNPPSSPTAPTKSTSGKKGGISPTNSDNGTARPYNQRQAGGARQWIPGHTENINGKDTWIRGHYAGDKQTTVDTLPQNKPKPSVATQPSTEQANPTNIKPQGWAIVIGISKYKHAAGKFPNLRYAASDAKEFYDFLRSPEGGGFPPERILFLADEKATLENINYAFFDFLKQALEEDYIVIYFSGHGTPEEDNLDNLYLMAYDSRPDRMASTAFPMWDIETAFKRYIKSEKVIMFADACHSAGISGDIATRNIFKKNMINKLLLEVGKAKKGRAIFTGSEAGELSQESRKWGGGHGVFTFYLLRGLGGEADINDNNIITLGEVIDFVSENVRRATNNKQHPDTAGIFDREFPLAIYQP